MTSKERVLSTLNFTNTQDRVPRQLWSLPWANEHCSEMMEQLARDFEWIRQTCVRVFIRLAAS